jgi:menaquinone reductase, molybdopterin-binding-like subunit
MGIDRRSFISLVAGGVVGSTFTPVIWKTLDDVSIWTQNWPWIPTLQYGEVQKVPALCKLGSDAYGIKIKTVAGRPVVAEGDPDHPLSLGGICPLGAASVHLMYSPSRVKNPKLKDGSSFKDISWDEAEEMLAEKIKAAGSSVAMISGDETGSVTDVLAGLVGKAGSDKSFLMPGESAPAAAALAMLGGDGQVGYDIENANYVLMLGADALGSWGNVARNGKAFSASREKGVKYIYVGPAQNGTTAVADSWIPCAAGTEPVLAMGLAAVIAESGRDRSFWPGFAAFAKFVKAAYPLDKVAEITGVSAETIKGLAGELVRAGRPLVLTAAEAGQGLGAFELAAGMSLNMLLERVNTVGGVRILPWAPSVVEAAADKKTLLASDVVAYLTAVADGGAEAPAVLMVHGANPAYALPNLTKAQAAIDKAGFVVSFSSFMDETAAMADLIMPDSYAFERLDDAYSPYGSGQPNYTVAAPVIKPVFDTKPAGDVILAVAAKADLDLGFESFEDVVKAKAEALGADFDEMVEGAAWVSEEFPAQDLALWTTPLEELSVAAADGKTLALAPVLRLKIGSAKIAIPPFNTNAIRFDEMLGNDMYVLMNAATAKNLGLNKDDAVKLAGAGGECKARLRIFEGVMNDTVVAPLGFGRTAWDDFSRGKGDNVYKLLAADTEAQTGLSRFATARVTVSKA